MHKVTFLNDLQAAIKGREREAERDGKQSRSLKVADFRVKAEKKVDFQGLGDLAPIFSPQKKESL